MKLSVIVPSLEGKVPESLVRAIEAHDEVEVVVVKGVSPVGKARNEGLRRASGEYIAWVDSDDEIDESWLEEIVGVISSSGTDVITFDAERVGWETKRDVVWGAEQKEVDLEKLRRDVYRDLDRPGSMWLYVTRRELWEGIEFDESVRIAEDYLALPRVLGRAKSIKYIPKKLYRYMKNEKSLINTEVEANDRAMFEIRRRRLEEAPREYRGAVLWGTALYYFWSRSGALRSEGRAFIKANMAAILKETFTAPDLTIGDRIKTAARFLSVYLWCRK